MDPARLKLHFNDTKYKRDKLKEELLKLADFIQEYRVLYGRPDREGAEKLRDCWDFVESKMEECNDGLVESYKFAIKEGIDVDDSRILKVYQFFYSKGEQITHLLRSINLPRGSNSIWGIIIVTAFFLLWADV